MVHAGTMVSFFSGDWGSAVVLILHCYVNNTLIIACLISNPSVSGERVRFFKLTCMLLWAVCDSVPLLKV